MNNKTFEKQALRHGEVVVIPIDALPEGIELEYEGKNHPIGHSETGHHHVLTADAMVFNPVSAVSNSTAYQFLCKKIWGDDSTLWPEELVPFKAKSGGQIVHQKSFDVHAPIDVLKGLYVKYTKRRFNYFSKMMEKVVD